MSNEYRSGFVAVVGRPNVGKSTLVNAMLGQKLAIISDKPQTTRNKILAIRTTQNNQIVFVDTPGIHSPRNKLGEYMVRAAKDSAMDADVVVFVTEAGRAPSTSEETILAEIKQSALPVILVINKVDLVSKELILPQIATISKLCSFASIVPVSAKKSVGLKELIAEIEKLLPVGPMFYPEDVITDMPQRQVAAEIIREKILGLLNKEVPHGIAVEIMQYKEEEKIVKIEATIYCEKQTHKGIIIGKGGTMLKRVGQRAREDIEKMEGKQVYLQLWVKVKEDWRDSNFLMRSFGYE